MSGEPMKIRLKPDAPLSSVKYRPIPVPFHFKQSAKRDIDGDTRLGILQKKPLGEAITYCSQIVFTPKVMRSLAPLLIIRTSMKQHPESTIIHPVRLIWFLQF